MTSIFKTLSLALITAGLMAAAQASPVALSAVVDFDEPASSLVPSRDVGLGDVITNQYARFGLEFTPTNLVNCSRLTTPPNPSCTAALRLAPPPPHITSPNFLVNSAPGTGFSINVLDGFSLSSLTLDIAANNAPFSVKFYDASGRHLSSPVTWANGSSSLWTTEVLGGLDTAVRRIEFGGNSSSSFAIDYLRFDYVANIGNLPEPAVPGLVALALAGLGLSRRRKG